MKTNYILTITQQGPRADKNFKNVIKSDDKAKVFEALARCYRDLNRSERAPAIKRASHTIRALYDEENKTHIFTIIYDVYSDHKVFSVYIWEFQGVD